MVIEQAFAMGTQGAEGGGGGWALIFPYVLIFFVFYFLLIRPQQRKQREHKQMLSRLKKGDRVVTSGGIYGSVVGIKEKLDVVVVRVAENVKIEVQRSAIAGRIEKEGEEEDN